MSARGIAYLIKQLQKNVKYNKYQTNNEKSVEKVLDKLGVDYIKQPNGCQMAPDFRVAIENKTIDIECKSSKTHYTPMWNSTYPDNKTLYLFSNQRDNKTIVFNGSAVMTRPVETIYKEYTENLKKLQKETNEKLNKIENPYKMRVYARKMFSQGRNLDKKKTGEYLAECLKTLGTTREASNKRKRTREVHETSEEPIAKRTRHAQVIGK
jgi:hypothetical protein